MCIALITFLIAFVLAGFITEGVNLQFSASSATVCGSEMVWGATGGGGGRWSAHEKLCQCFACAAGIGSLHNCNLAHDDKKNQQTFSGAAVALAAHPGACMILGAQALLQELLLMILDVVAASVYTIVGVAVALVGIVMFIAIRQS